MLKTDLATPSPLLVTKIDFPDHKQNVYLTVTKPAQDKKIAEEKAAAIEAAQAILNARQVYTPKQVVAPVQSAVNASDSYYKLFIYNHESGNNPTRYNGSGCLGLGQACPASKLLAVCPTMSYACEDAWFTNYAISRYGSWAGAYSFWISRHWW